MSDPALSDPDSERGGLHMGCTTANEDPYNTQALEEEERRLYEQTPATQLLPIDVYNDDSVIVIPHNTSGGTGDTMFLYTVLMVHVCQFFLHFKGWGRGGGQTEKVVYISCFQTVNLVKASSRKKNIVRLQRSW